MNEKFEPNFEHNQELDYEQGYAKLEEEAKKLQEKLNRCIIIAISGRPNSGKSHLINEFLLKNQGYRSNTNPNGRVSTIIKSYGPDPHFLKDEISDWLGGKYIIFETLYSRKFANQNLREVDESLNIDLYIYIYNPRFGNKESRESKDANFVIKNDNSVKKTL